MRSLLEINVLIALLDCDHTSHQDAVRWFGKHAPEGWASCPLTQNGCVRIMSSPGYANPLPVQAIVARLTEACAADVHKFWSDELSLLDCDVFDPRRIHGPRQLTDIYLLGLAVHRKGRLVTFDSGIPLAAVQGAQPRHLLVL